MGWGWVWCVVVVGVCLFGDGEAEKIEGYSQLFELEVEDRTSFLSAAGFLFFFFLFFSFFFFSFLFFSFLFFSFLFFSLIFNLNYLTQ